MSAQHPNILFIGDSERGYALEKIAERNGAVIFLPEETFDALAMYITYLPDITVIDTSVNRHTAAETYYHLRSVKAAPILVLTEDDWWDIGADETVHMVHPAISNEELISLIEELVASPQLQPSL
jgi:hypothetical protein